MLYFFIYINCNISIKIIVLTFYRSYLKKYCNLTYFLQTDNILPPFLSSSYSSMYQIYTYYFPLLQLLMSDMAAIHPSLVATITCFDRVFQISSIPNIISTLVAISSFTTTTPYFISSSLSLIPNHSC